MGEAGLLTIGFTKRSAEQFFESLRSAGVRRVLDVRLNRTSQLSGFAKAGDLAYFLDRLGGIELVHVPELAPTDELLSAYRGREITWDDYEARYLDLIVGRQVETTVDPALLAGGCLLCSEAGPEQCHRRVAAEYLASRNPGLTVEHL